VTSDDPTVMRLAGVRFQYPGASSWALNGVDLHVNAGEVLGLVGPNDSGKTTVCLVAAGLAPGVTGGRLEGDVRLSGEAAGALGAGGASPHVGILFQQPRSQLSGTAMTVWEEIAFGPRNLGLPIDDIADRVERAVGLLGIEELAARDPARLSGGQGQLVAFASVLAMEPAALVLDEPTSQLDPEGTRLVGEAIARAAAQRRSAVLVVEHKTALLASIADRIVVLGPGGRSILTGPAAEVLGSDGLVEAGVEPPPAVRLRRSAATRLAPETGSRIDAELAAIGGP